MPDARRLLTLAAVVVAAVLAHVRALGAGFVYDDHRFVVHNPAVRSLADPVSFFTDPRTASAVAGIESDVYRPLRTLHFAVDHALFDAAPRGWHFASLLLHALVSALVWVLLLRVVGPGAGRAGRAAALFGALLFAVHPVTAEAVAWVSSRGDLLAMLLVLAGLEVLRKGGGGRTAAGAALVLAGCLAKESAVVAFAWLPLRDLALPPAVRPPARTTALRAALLLGAALAYLGVRAMAMEAADGRPLAQVEPVGGRALVLATTLSAVAGYARALLLPTGFPFERDHAPAASFAEPSVVLGAGIVLTLLLAGVSALRRGRGALALGCLGPLVALVPVSNVLVPLKTFWAERFLYPALPFLAALAALGLRALLARARPVAAKAVLVAAAVAVGLLAVATYRREGAWRDDESLWTAVLREDPSNPRAYEGLGFSRMVHGDPAGAERAYRTYLESARADGKSWAVLGDLYGGVAREREISAGFPDPNHPLTIESVLPEDVDPSRSGTRETLDGARYARRKQIEAYQRAIDVWERVGLARGRGSPALRRNTVVALRQAAMRMADLATSRIANALLAREDVRDTGRVAYAQRRFAVVLALLATDEQPRSERPPRPDERARRMRARADLLRDAGVDPNLSDRDAREALLPAMNALLGEQGDDGFLRRRRAAVLRLRAGNRPTSEVETDLRTVLEDLRWMVARDPDDAAAEAHLRALRARLGE